MGDYISPFNFKEIFLEYFLGTPELFTFAFMIVTSMSCAYFQMSNRLFLLILSISSIIFGLYLGNAIYILVIFLIGYISFKSIARIVT